MRRVYRARRRPCDPLVRDDGWLDRQRRHHDTRRARDKRASASDPASVHRRPGRAVRLLFERRHPDRQGVHRSESARHRQPDPRGAFRGAVPMLHARADDSGHRQLRAEGGMTPRFSPEARTVLEREGLSRRRFLRGSGALVVGFATAKLAPILGVAPDRTATQATRATDSQLDAWLAIAADGTVTAFTGKCELGQGMFTVQTQLVAEELGVAVGRVRLIQCDTARTPDQGTTSGSQSHPTNFNERNLALAAATAREALLQMAAARLQMEEASLQLSDGVIAVRSEPTRRVTVGELVGGRTFNVALNPRARRKPASAWTVLGTSVPRVDLPAMVTAELEYVHNVHVPGMLYGAVVRPPETGATLVSVNERSVATLPGVVKVVVKNNFVGIVAEKPWYALQAAAKLEAKWNTGKALPDHDTFYEFLRMQPARDALVVDSGDIDRMLTGATRTVRASYRHPYQMHGSMGSSCAVADVA